MRLKHCFVESPTRGDNLYRFKVTTQGLRGRFELPSYFWHLNEDVQAWVSGATVLGYGRCNIKKDMLEVSVDVSVDGEFMVLVVGTRRDDIARSYFDDEGGVEF
jgi:hypothetical protein